MGELIHSPIVFRLDASHTITAMSGTAATPLSTADQKSALMASTCSKFIAIPMRIPGGDNSVK